MPLCQLKERALLRLGGPDTRAFLQGILTQDVTRLTPEQPLYGALLSPQGKCLFDLFLFERDGDVVLDADASRIDELIRKLLLYRLRQKVNITQVSDLAVWQAWGEDAAKIALGVTSDPRDRRAGSRFLAPARINGDDIAAWHAFRLPLGLPEADEIGTDILWLEANGRELNGVSFNKGCFVGQENTARMHHRDRIRKRLLPLKLSADVAPDQPVVADAKAVGQLRGTAHAGWQMALLKMDALGQDLTVGGHPVEAVLPPWVPR